MKSVVSMLVGAGVLLMCSAVPRADASVVLGEELWDNGTVGTPAWIADETYVTVTQVGGVGDGYLNIAYDSGRTGGDAETVVYTDAGAFFAGNWDDASQDGAWVAFDFWADDNTPSNLELRFTGASATIWSYALTPPSAGGGPVDYTASLLFNASSWLYGGGTGSESTFLNDLASIDWIGVYINDEQTAANNYGLDNFQLMVPEPTEVALALSALAVTLLALRRRRTQDAAQAA